MTHKRKDKVKCTCKLLKDGTSLKPLVNLYPSDV